MMITRQSNTIRAAIVPALLACTVLASGCNPSRQVYSHGYQVNEESLALVPEGSSREQVLLTLGTPSTTQNQTDGGETFYYISQRKERPVAFLSARVVDQRVLSIYFDSSETVTRIANFGLKDGKVFDFISRTTPTGGKEMSFVGQILSAAGGGASAQSSASDILSR